MSELKINPTPDQVVMLCNGETIEVNGKKISLTVVEQEPESDYSHLVGKYVRYWLKGFEHDSVFNKWHKIEKVDIKKKVQPNEYDLEIWAEKQTYEFVNKVSKGINNETCCFDLNNPLDYNPTELIGKYINGVKLERIYYADGKPCFRTDLGSVDFICSYVNPSEVTDTPPTKSLKYEDVLLKEKPMWWVTLGGSIQSDAFDLDESLTNVPTEGDAKKLRATAQLLVVMHHANGGEWMPKNSEERYSVFYGQENEKLQISNLHHVLFQIYFRTRELAEQALNDNKQLFNEYFGIDE